MKYYFLWNLILLTKCQNLLKPRVVGGDMAQIRQFPHSGFMKVLCYKHKNVGWICGSSIVNQRILLTAGHCVETCGVRDRLSVSTGHANREQGATSSVHSIYLHERFSRNEIINDIGLLRLKTDLKFSPEVQRVALMEKPPYFEKAQIAGWGFVKEIDTIQGTEVLHYIDQYVWVNRSCKKKIKRLKKGSFCASSRVETSYASGGDSGSALVVRGYIQIGIVSYKMPNISKSLVVYTDTGFFYEWIKKNSKKLYCVIEQG